MKRIINLFVCLMILSSTAAYGAKVEVTTTRRLLPTMVYLIGTYDSEGNPDVCIVDRGGILETSTPLKYYISLKDSRQTTKNILANKSFTINIPNSGILAQMDYMGQVHADSGDAYFNKLGVTGLNYAKAEGSGDISVNAPILTDCNIVYECVLATDEPYTFDDSDYKMYAANIVRTHVKPAIMTDSEAVPGVGNVSIKSADIIFFSGAGGDLAGYYKANATGLARYSTWKEKYSDEDVAGLLTAPGSSGSRGRSSSGETPSQEKYEGFATVLGGLHFLPAPVMVLGAYTNAGKATKTKPNFATYHRGGLLVTGDATYIGIGIKGSTSWTRECVLSNDGYASISIPSVEYLPEADLVGTYSGRPLSGDGSFVVSTDEEGYQDKTAPCVAKGRITLDTTYEAPMINQFPINFICKHVKDIVVADDTSAKLMVFKVLKTFVDENYISENGDNAKINPIVGTDTDTALTFFAHPTHGYFSYGDFLGKSGLSTSKYQTSSTATSFIINDDNNKAELIFLLTPEGSNADVDQTMQENKFIGAVNHTTISSNTTENYTDDGVSGAGFKLNITLDGIPSGYSGIIGINKVCYLTEENLGELFPYTYAAFNKAADIEGAPGWKETTSADFKAAGLSVWAMSSDSTPAYEITPYISAGVYISDDSTMILSYGTVLIDGAIDENEGKVYAINPEEGGEGTMHDGSADGKIAATWFVKAVKSEVKAIPEEDNKAELSFVITPAELDDTTAKESLETHKIKFVTEENIGSGAKSEIREITNDDQIENGGFKMSIPINSKDFDETYRPALGIQKMFVFTADNIGSERYNALKNAIASLEKKSNGFLAERPSTTVLTNSGIHIFASYPENATSSSARVAGVSDTDISDQIDFNLMQSDDSSIVMGYGAIIVDRALTANEGGEYETSQETTRVTSDGASDYVLTAEWYMTASDVIYDEDEDTTEAGQIQGPGSSSGGCAVYSWPLMIFAALAIKKRR